SLPQKGGRRRRVRCRRRGLEDLELLSPRVILVEHGPIVGLVTDVPRRDGGKPAAVATARKSPVVRQWLRSGARSRLRGGEHLCKVESIEANLDLPCRRHTRGIVRPEVDTTNTLRTA